MIVILWVALVVLIGAFGLAVLASFAAGMSDAGDDESGSLLPAAAVVFLIAIVVVIVFIVRHYTT